MTRHKPPKNYCRRGHRKTRATIKVREIKAPNGKHYKVRDCLICRSIRDRLRYHEKVTNARPREADQAARTNDL